MVNKDEIHLDRDLTFSFELLLCKVGKAEKKSEEKERKKCDS